MRTYTIPEFCEVERISPSFYYKLKKQGLAPREMELGSARRITEEARTEWHRARETATSKKTEAA